jgi:protein-S-isoprenylcysteine O-methyltransferase Ste14
MLVYPELITVLWPIQLLQTSFIQISGIVAMTIALVIGLAALFEMKNSWRVGIRYEQKTKLVTTGIYSLSRNPYFLSYDLLFVGIFLVFPIFIFLLLTLGLILTFHQMILEEERYLLGAQGTRYHQYKAKTRRYLF